MKKAMGSNIFITGTDTDAGKSYVSVALLQGLASLGHSALGFKPVAAGVDAEGKNSDALQLQAASTEQLAYETVNPILFAEPCAPHLVGNIDETALQSWVDELSHIVADVKLIEGAGGWLLPISAERYLADWVVENQWPVILVVGMKLGCLNHAMLTFRELQRSGVPLIGWVANQIDPEMLRFEDNLNDLQQRLTIPFLGLLPYAPAGVSPSNAKALATTMCQQIL